MATGGSGMKTHSLFLVLLGSLALQACETVSTTQAGAVGVERKQTMLVSEQQVEQGAAKAYDEELTKARDKGELNSNATQLARVRGIGERLIRQTPAFRSDAADWKWNINVQTSKEMNAYCMPGGKIMVYTGLIEQLKTTDAELAAVVGHEIAHALREHSREAVSRAYAQQLGLSVLGAVTGIGDTGTQIVGMVTNVTFSLPRSRQQEIEADQIGLELMARAGYDPAAAITLWQKMAAANSNAPPQFLSTHPSSSTRSSELQALQPKVLPLYQASSKN
jgi:predicted Zn-dependent protease